MASKQEGPVRRPAVAGLFYPAHPLQLRTAVERFLVRTLDPVRALCLVVPHAGYVYSGATAGKTYAACELPRRLVILCPNHTGLGVPLSCWPSGAWVTPLGEVPVDDEAARFLLSAVPGLEADERAHLREHAVEVQLPFLQVYLESFSFVPVAVGTHRAEDLAALGHGLAEFLRRFGGEAALVVSSDMNHYESAAVNRRKDGLALDALAALDPEGLYRTVLDHDVSMCGFAPAVAALHAVRETGGGRADLVDYTHSGLVTGDHDQVVSYAGLRIHREAA